ncbi:MAG TPA: hydantoinase/oxoprolinase family protein, partial [Dehalococcoidia bacterium]|nr:hydantoinase/oxoprolinase family protein [Dehalococcoidia bacterium]
MTPPEGGAALLGVDVGGTFTDFVLLRDGRLTVHKLLTTAEDQSIAFLQGVEDLAAGDAAIVHGSTVATNALLERKGARTALITTAGFADVIEIGRQTRPLLYDLHARKAEPFVPPERRFEVPERIDYLGQVLQPLDPATVDPIVGRLLADDVESVAVCCLFSFLQPDHERAIAERLRAAPRRFHISLSSDILPEYREFERTSTTVMNAYVGPLMEGYLTHLEAGLGKSIRVMQSNGGIISAAVARQAAVRTALSGPAGGVIGARYVAGLAGFEEIITFDIGGTSTDVALCPGRLPIAQDAEVAGFPIRVPLIDIHTVGAGGGSIARVDAGGALVVGPESAGSRPGPVCYGRGGDRITVTDAHLALGRLDAAHFLDGRMQLDPARMEARLAALGSELGVDSTT